MRYRAVEVATITIIVITTIIITTVVVHETFMNNGAVKQHDNHKKNYTWIDWN